MKRVLFVVATALLTAGCGGDKTIADPSRTISEESLKQRCADPKWREENLGLWYSVCRQPVHW